MLIEATQRLWEIFKEKPELNGFVLIGGSALALQIHHRRSEDLDFAWPYGKLPREALDNLIRNTSSLQFILDQNEAAEREAEDCNLDLADHSQNYLVDGVRVTFFKSPDAESRLLQGSESDQVRVAKVPEIFALKALATADRSKSRDWFDLYTLFRSHGYQQNGFVAGVGLSDLGSFNLQVLNINGTNITTSANYRGLQLYLYNGDHEVVPELGTWILMVAGLALLIIIQCRRNKID